MARHSSVERAFRTTPTCQNHTIAVSWCGGQPYKAAWLQHAPVLANNKTPVPMPRTTRATPRSKDAVHSAKSRMKGHGWERGAQEPSKSLSCAMLTEPDLGDPVCLLPPGAHAAVTDPQALRESHTHGVRSKSHKKTGTCEQSIRVHKQANLASRPRTPRRAAACHMRPKSLAWKCTCWLLVCISAAKSLNSKA